MKIAKISLLIGLGVTAVVAASARYYLVHADPANPDRGSGAVYETMEAVDLRLNDLKYVLRKPLHPDVPVALIAIDDATVQEVQRWPWSRELVGELTQKLIDNGVKSVAFDAIFSEPQQNGAELDAKFAAVVEKNKDKVILGVFGEKPTSAPPYQDFCMNEAFLAAGGDGIVKLNTTFIVNDTTTGEFDDLRWKPFFENIFHLIDADTEARRLKDAGLQKLEELKPFERRFVENQKKDMRADYCHRWLTDEDEFMKEPYLAAVKTWYLDLVAESKEYSTVSFETFVTRLKAMNARHPVPEYDRWTANIPALQNASDYTGSFVTQLDTDGYVRRYPLFYRAGNRIGTSYIPSLALQSYLLATGYRADVTIEMNRRGDSRKITSFAIVNPQTDPETKVMEIPIDAAGQTLLNYYGPQQAFYHVPAKELFSDRETMKVSVNTFGGNRLHHEFKEEIVKKKDFLNGRAVIVGATAVGLYDLRNIPLEANYPGPEIHMTMMGNLFQQKFVRAIPGEATWLPLVLLAAGIIFSLMLATFESFHSFIAALILLAVAGSVDVGLFIYANYKTSLHFLISEFVFLYFGITIYKYFTEEKKKRELRSTFSKYVSPAIVDELLADPDKLKLGGRRQRMTAFFSDVRGFTTISEKLTPEQLSDVLNKYLSPMTEIVFKNDGTLDKYMGDAIMAFFGAPIAFDDHALRACRCALQNLAKLKEVQAEFERDGLPRIDIGIGLNTGPMSVGNMGSNIVQNYTIMGDSVNLASRLEGITKEYGVRIVISEFTYEDVKGKMTAREIDRVKVKGKTEPVRIFELIQEEPPTGDLKENLDLFGRGYNLYMDKRFADAKEVFKEALKFSQSDPVSELYIERCDEFLAEPPPADWDGVYVMKTK